MVAPYKKTGLMTSSFQGSSGAALAESIRTSNMLSAELKQMSNFFFSQAAEQRAIEGEEYGAANAPSYEELVEAEKEGENLLNYGPTVFGRAAKRSALATVENEIIVDSSERFDNLVYEATRNMVSPKVLRNDLDAAITGYHEVLEATNPALARKMKAKLSLNANALFDAYRKKYQTSILASNGSSNSQGVDVQLNNDIRVFENFLDNMAVTPNMAETIMLQVNTLNNNYRNLLVASGYTKSTLQNKLEEHLNGLNSAAQSFIVQSVLTKQVGKKSEIATGIRNGAIQGHSGDLDIDKINAMLPYFTDTMLLSMSEQIISMSNQQLNIENNEIAADQEAKRNFVKEKELEISKLLTVDDRNINVAAVESLIEEIENSGADNALEVATKLRKALTDTGGETASKIGLVQQLEGRIIARNLEYKDLLKERLAGNLNVIDFNKLLTELEKHEKGEYKDALTAIAKELNITTDDYGSIQPGSTASEANKEIFMEAKKMLDEAFREALQSTGSDNIDDVVNFNGEKIAQNFKGAKLNQLKEYKIKSYIGRLTKKFTQIMLFEGFGAVPGESGVWLSNKSNALKASLAGIKNKDIDADYEPLLDILTKFSNMKSEQQKKDLNKKIIEELPRLIRFVNNIIELQG